jgi:hypothetical protein
VLALLQSESWLGTLPAVDQLLVEALYRSVLSPQAVAPMAVV